LPEELREWDIYLTSIYFSVSTSTTVGYGDFYGNTTYERLYLLPAEFIGICMFSIISGITGNLLELPTLLSIINEKKNDVKVYLQSIDRARFEEAQLDDDIYDNTVHFIEHSYQVGVVQSLQRDNDFYKKLSPDLKNSMVFALLYDYYDKFFYFFNDVER
jgi:hypothetical protein